MLINLMEVKATFSNKYYEARRQVNSTEWENMVPAECMQTYNTNIHYISYGRVPYRPSNITIGAVDHIINAVNKWQLLLKYVDIPTNFTGRIVIDKFENRENDSAKIISCTLAQLQTLPREWKRSDVLWTEVVDGKVVKIYRRNNSFDATTVRKDLIVLLFPCLLELSEETFYQITYDTESNEYSEDTMALLNSIKVKLETCTSKLDAVLANIQQLQEQERINETRRLVEALKGCHVDFTDAYTLKLNSLRSSMDEHISEYSKLLREYDKINAECMQLKETKGIFENIAAFAVDLIEKGNLVIRESTLRALKEHCTTFVGQAISYSVNRSSVTDIWRPATDAVYLYTFLPIIYWSNDEIPAARNMFSRRSIDQIHLFNAVISGRYQLWCKQQMKFSLQTGDLQRDHWTTLNFIEQPHIGGYNCWGNNRNQMLATYTPDSIEFWWSTVLQTLQQINLTDYTVLTKMMEWLTGTYKNCRCFLDTETNTWLTPNEVLAIYKKGDNK